MIIFPSFLQMTIDLKGQAVEQKLPFVQATDDGGFSAFISTMLTALMAVAAVSVLLFLVWGAFDYINSGGEKGKIDSARNKMTGAVMGLVVLAMVLVIFIFIQNLLGITIINFIPSSGSAGAALKQGASDAATRDLLRAPSTQDNARNILRGAPAGNATTNQPNTQRN